MDRVVEKITMKQGQLHDEIIKMKRCFKMNDEGGSDEDNIREITTKKQKSVQFRDAIYWSAYTMTDETDTHP